MVFIGTREPDNEEKISVEIAVVEGADGNSRGSIFADEDDVGSTGLDE